MIINNIKRFTRSQEVLETNLKLNVITQKRCEASLLKFLYTSPEFHL